MDKTYKIPSKQELEQSKGKGRKGIQKHLILRHDLDSLVTEYAKKLGISQSQVIEEMIVGGINRFEVNHGFKIAEKQGEKRTEDLTKQLNERVEREMERKKKEASAKSKALEEAYGKKICHDYSNDEQWQRGWFG
jgi:regulator of PEP synthase PpsR (kinase-PPPase family)